MFTVISIFPQPIRETKPGQHPSEYNIPRCKDYDDPQIIYVDDAIDFHHVAGDQISVKVPIFGKVVAESLVKDFQAAMILSDENVYPGLMYVEGKLGKEEVKKLETFDKLKKTQDEWALRLIQQADDDWAKTRQHKMITELQKHFCRRLGLKREWNVDIADAKTFACPACLELVSSKAIICRSCKNVLKPEEYKKLEFAS